MPLQPSTRNLRNFCTCSDAVRLARARPSRRPCRLTRHRSSSSLGGERRDARHALTRRRAHLQDDGDGVHACRLPTRRTTAPSCTSLAAAPIPRRTVLTQAPKDPIGAASSLLRVLRVADQAKGETWWRGEAGYSGSERADGCFWGECSSPPLSLARPVRTCEVRHKWIPPPPPVSFAPRQFQPGPGVGRHLKP